MPRRVFFSFHYEKDAWKVGQIRNSGIVRSEDQPPYYDAAQWEEAKQRAGGIKAWIDAQLRGTSVTVVLIGEETASRQWVQYEIQQSHSAGKGMLGIQMTGMIERKGLLTATQYYDGPNPFDASGVSRGLYGRTYPIYSWESGNGRANMSRWIEDAWQRANNNR